MSGAKELARILGTDEAAVSKIAPLLSDAAAALAETRVPSEAEIHEIVANTYRYTPNESLESEDTDRQLEAAMKVVSKWREHAQIYLNGATVLLRRTIPALGRYEAKKRVLAGLRSLDAGTAAQRFFFTRETAIELAPELVLLGPLPAAPARGTNAFGSPPAAELERGGDLTDPQRDLLVRLMAIVMPAKSPDAARVVELVARAGDRIGPSVLRAMGRPEESAKSVGGTPGELHIAIRRLIPRLSDAWSERILRSALEAGWLEWIDRPVLDPPLNVGLRERLLKEFGTRQDPRGNPYRPSDSWFYNLDL